MVGYCVVGVLIDVGVIGCYWFVGVCGDCFGFSCYFYIYDMGWKGVWCFGVIDVIDCGGYIGLWCVGGVGDEYCDLW